MYSIVSIVHLKLLFNFTGVNIVFGLQIDESAAPITATYAVIVYASIFLIVEGLLELHERGTYSKGITCTDLFKTCRQ